MIKNNSYPNDIFYKKYYVNDSLNHQSDTYKNLKSSQLASLYFSKYCKYKNKYIKLKKYLGGSSFTSITEQINLLNDQILKDISGKLFIPCEINNFTKNLYISQHLIDYNLYHTLNVIFRNFIVVRSGDANYFMQDPYILLKDSSNNDYAIEVRSGYSGFLPNKILKYNSDQTTNHFGGNFISAPNKKIFTIDNTYLQDNVGSHLLEQPIVLDCSFQTNGRHIDELMCFMPYGLRKYKIWIYYIDNIELEYLIPKIEDVLLKFEKFKERKDKIPYEENIAERVNRIKRITIPAHKKINPYKNVDNTLKSDIEFLNIERFKKDFGPPDYFVLYNHLKEIDIQLPPIESIRKILDKERENNLNKISNALFGGIYKNNMENFVSFPIDLSCEVKIENNEFKYFWNIISIPIFNRLLVETDSLRKCVFPTGALTDKVNLILEQEKIKSYLNNESFEFIDVNTDEYNQGHGAVGGNVHCLIKNQY
jgi:hypothetical protein